MPSESCVEEETKAWLGHITETLWNEIGADIRSQRGKASLMTCTACSASARWPGCIIGLSPGPLLKWTSTKVSIRQGAKQREMGGTSPRHPPPGRMEMLALRIMQGEC